MLESNHLKTLVLRKNWRNFLKSYSLNSLLKCRQNTGSRRTIKHT